MGLDAVFAERAMVVFAVWRLVACLVWVPILRADVFFVAGRDMELVSRTAALAKPTPATIVIMRYASFLILCGYFSLL